MYIVGRHPEHTYAIELLNDKGEWVRDMYDVPIDEYSIKKLAKHYKLRGYTLKKIRIVKVL